MSKNNTNAILKKVKDYVCDDEENSEIGDETDEENSETERSETRRENKKSKRSSRKDTNFQKRAKRAQRVAYGNFQMPSSYPPDVRLKIEKWIKTNDTNILLDLSFLSLKKIPLLPPNVKQLNLSNNDIRTVNLPPNLEELYINNNSLERIKLPDTLKKLDISSTRIQEIKVPKNLTELWANNILGGIKKIDYNSHLNLLSIEQNSLVNIDKFPSTLTHLYCSFNNISSLPELPPNLTHLFCANNNLRSLPRLPSTLVFLVVDNNYLTSLPPLPSTLKKLYATSNDLWFLPSLPQLDTLDVSYNKLENVGNLCNDIPSCNIDNQRIVNLSIIPSFLRNIFTISQPQQPVETNREERVIEDYLTRIKDLKLSTQNFPTEKCNNTTDFMGDNLSSEYPYISIINRHGDKYTAYCYTYDDLFESLKSGEPIYIWKKDSSRPTWIGEPDRQKPVYKESYTGIFFDKDGFKNILKYNTLVLIPLREEYLGTGDIDWVSSMHGTEEDKKMVYTLRPINRSIFLSHQKITDDDIDNFNATTDDMNLAYRE